ncbi:MAG TPA: GNAT family N-acetyltransferase [Propionibacteriaceae bacterium]|nr:GNAT family N-acetyltransferase [Propionibacteriaceae bacterium]
MSFTVTDHPEASRYELRAGDTVVGFARYHLRAGTIVFTHTQVSDEYEGQGAGSQLAQEALDDARRRGLRVVALCPFIAGWIQRHPDYADLVA